MAKNKTPIFLDKQLMELSWAILDNDFDKVKTIYTENLDLSTVGDRGYTVTHFALLAANTDILTFLLERGADPVSILENGDTAPHRTASRDDGAIGHLQVLFEYPLDPNLIGGQINKSLLTAAVYGENFAAIKFLLEKGADINWVDDFIGTVLHTVLATNMDMKLSKFLVEQGANLNIKGKNFDTPLNEYCMSALRIQKNRKQSPELELQFKQLDDLIFDLHGIRFPCDRMGNSR